MTGQVDPEPASGLPGPRIGPTATPEPQPGRAHLDLRPVPDPLAQGGFRERTPDDVSVTDEVDRPGASDPRRQLVRPPRDGLHPAQDPDPVNPSLQPPDAGFGRRRCHRRIGDGGVDTVVDRVEETPGLLPPAVSPARREPRRARATAILPVAGLEAPRDRFLVVRRYHVGAAIAKEKLGRTPRWRQREDPGLELHVLEDLGGDGHVNALR